MGIYFNEESKSFYLESRDLTYAFYINAIGFPEHLHFGRRVAHDKLNYIFARGSSSFRACLTDGGICLNDLPAEVSFYGNGDYHEPTFQIGNAAGDRLSKLEYVGHTITDEKPMPAGMPGIRRGQTLVLELKDKFHPLTVKLYYTVFEDVSAIVRRAEYINTGSEPLSLYRAYSFNLDLPRNDYDVITLQGAWARECGIERTPLHHGVTSVDSKRASSSAVLNPFMALADKTATEDYGEAFGVNLLYSSSFVLKAEVGINGHTAVMGGINDFNFTWKLDAGEHFDTPEAALVYSDCGIGGMSRQFHNLYRNYLIDPTRVYEHRPVVINNWEGTYFDFNNERLMAIVDGVKGSGINTFVLDDGWFGARNNDRAGLGDWVVNCEKLKGGLKTIIDYTHAAGLKFGLWFEPEMVNPDSDLYRAHPEWAIHCPGHEPTLARHQLTLDITRADVRDYIVESVSAILRGHDIDYVKWDFNRNITENYSEALPADRQKEFHHRYALGLYDICERLVYGFPNVFFEGCSGGGARFDAGVMYYFPQIWTSDDTDAYMRTRIQYGASLAYPLSVMSCHVSACPNHQTGRFTSFRARADIAHLGATGYELDPAKTSAEDLAAVPDQVAAYHDMEELVLRGDLYRLASTQNSNYFIEQLVLPDGSRSVLTAMRALVLANDEAHRVYPRGLCEDALYYIPELDRTLHGSTIMHVGLKLEFDRADFNTKVWHMERVSEEA